MSLVPSSTVPQNATTHTRPRPHVFLNISTADMPWSSNGDLGSGRGRRTIRMVQINGRHMAKPRLRTGAGIATGGAMYSANHSPRNRNVMAYTASMVVSIEWSLFVGGFAPDHVFVQ